MDLTEIFKREVWNKAEIVDGNDPDIWRKDRCGAWIGYGFYGNRDSQYGWEIDHILPVARGGTDSLNNLSPLQWENNLSKGDSMFLSCRRKAVGISNV